MATDAKFESILGQFIEEKVISCTAVTLTVGLIGVRLPNVLLHVIHVNKQHLKCGDFDDQRLRSNHR